jgi:hypothetical protein
MGRHANYLNGMTSWRLAVTLTVGRNTRLAILKDAGIQGSHGTPSTDAAARTVDAALVGGDPEFGMGISKLSAAQRCDDGTVTFQRAWPPQGSTQHRQWLCPQAVGTPSSPKIVASDDYWRSMPTHEITRGIQPTSVATQPSWRAHLLLNSGLWWPARRSARDGCFVAGDPVMQPSSATAETAHSQPTPPSLLVMRTPPLRCGSTAASL